MLDSLICLEKEIYVLKIVAGYEMAPTTTPVPN